MNLIRYEPWNTTRRAQRDFDGLFGDHFFAPLRRQSRAHWVPAVDVREDAGEWILTADLPGIAPADIEISAENGQLVLRGERHSDVNDEHEGYRRTERYTGKFERRFELPDTADADAIRASSKDGVLSIAIPKKAQLQPRRIEISTD